MLKIILTPLLVIVTFSLVRNCIQLAACGKDQLLPMNPELAAADLFTACLTTPIKMALRWFVMTNDLGHLAPEVSIKYSCNLLKSERQFKSTFSFDYGTFIHG